uniref:Tetraspanin n=1 Tax=Oryzias latipes TaxID=8090 RepID=A0A3B3IG85_ORYLA
MSGNPYKGGHEVSCCIKYFIFGFNILFWGVLSNISSITDLGGLDPVWLFVVVGGVMFILGFAGCIGALRENTFLLKFFSVFLGIIFFLELTAGILAFVFKDWIKDQLNLFINNNIRAYRDDIDLQNLIDFTQEYWECCGAFGVDDWNLNIYFNCTDGNPSREKCGVPFSCCTKDPAEDVINTQCGYDIRAKPVSPAGHVTCAPPSPGLLCFQNPRHAGLKMKSGCFHTLTFLVKVQSVHLCILCCRLTTSCFYVEASAQTREEVTRSGWRLQFCLPAQITGRLCFQDSEQKDYINVKGCVPQFEKWLQDNLTLVAGIFIGVALLQVRSVLLRTFLKVKEAEPFLF